jgi:anti-sigma regulatory factor (Ser/Thr protein kinase)
MDVRFLLRLPVGPATAFTARRAVEGLDAYLAPELSESIQILISELVTNAVRHAGLREEDFVDVNVWCTQDHVRVEVSDPGPGFISNEHELTGEEVSGWGLYLVRRLADRWGMVRDEANCVWFELDQATSGSPKRSSSANS